MKVLFLTNLDIKMKDKFNRAIELMDIKYANTIGVVHFDGVTTNFALEWAKKHHREIYYPEKPWMKRNDKMWLIASLMSAIRCCDLVCIVDTPYNPGILVEEAALAGKMGYKLERYIVSKKEVKEYRPES
jgi:hypothetical protein